MSSILEAIWQGAMSATWLEQVATILGVGGVWLMIRQNLWAFPVGILQVSLSAVVFYEYRLYADMALQVVFLAALVYGWWHWIHGGSKRDEQIPVTRLTMGAVVGWVLVGLAVNGFWGWWLAGHTDASMPYADAFIAAFSLVGQWLQARKKLENWICWLVVDLFAVGVFWRKELYWFAVLYGLFCFMAWGGLRAWRRSWRERGAEVSG